MAKARIKLSSTDEAKLTDICNQIKLISERTGAEIKGPIPLPTRKLKITTRKCPCGSGRETYETWQMRVHKRLIDLGADDRALHLILKTPIPKEVHIEMQIIE